jgi:phosphoadenosine phosphosulfate reductase
MSLLGHEKVMLSFSGGKDSLAALYMVRDWLDCITVVHADTGAAYPHMKAFIESTCRKLGAKLVLVGAQQRVLDYTEQYGLPTDILPIWRASEYDKLHRERPDEMLQSCLTCCDAMIWTPIQEHIRDAGYTLVIRGAKEVDAQRGVAPGFVENGVTYESPIWDWTDEDVFEYLKSEGAELPAQYAWGDLDSLDCWCCTGHAGRYLGARIKYTKIEYPELYQELASRVDRMRTTVRAETKRINDDIESGLDNTLVKLRRGVS